jgi:hypothetical protein
MLAQTKGTTEKLVTAAFFASCLIVFSLTTATNFVSRRLLLEDNRLAADCQFHVSDLAGFSKDFEKYFNDRLGFRERLIACRNLVKVKVFKVSASSDVLIGKDGYLFCSSKGGDQGLLHGSPLFSEQDLANWKSLLEKRARWCRNNGMDYLFVLAPGKVSIYRELLPSPFNKTIPMTRTDQLIAFLRKTKSPVQSIDLRETLRAGKGSWPLYLKTDTHWNQLGAYYAYCAIINKLKAMHQPIASPVPIDNFRVVPYIFTKGDLARLEGLLGILTEDNIAVNRKSTPPWAIVKYPLCFCNKYGVKDTTPFYCESPKSKSLKALMFRDSFASPLAELYLPEHFSKISFYWQPDFSEQIVSREKPNIVIQEALETCLYGDIPPA